MADRREYTRSALDEASLAPDPFAQFGAWYRDASAAGLLDVDAMTLATSTPDGTPSARVVLLKQFDARGFVFFTDARSRKGEELAANPHAALVFYWAPLERQVRVTGAVSRLPAGETEEYFRTRPLESRLGAWASVQSAPIAGRDALEARLREVRDQFPHGDVPLPPHWSGYRVEPTAVEFWQGREGRLHDRLCYLATPGGWRVERLSP